MPRGKRGPRPEAVEQPEEAADEQATETGDVVPEAEAEAEDEAPEASSDGSDGADGASEPIPTEPVDTGKRNEAGERMFAKSCPVKLTAEERLRKALEWEAAALKLEQLEGDKAKTMAEFNASLKAQREAVRRLREEFSTAREERMISLVERPNWDTKRMELYRVDDGTLEEDRAMRPDELQRPLDFSGHRPEDVMANPDTNPVGTAATAA